MGRRKVQIRRIEDDRARKVTFAKRKHGLVKKAMELSLLCDCDIALLIFTREKRFYKYTTTNINSILQKLAKNPPVVEDRHNGMYEQLYVKKGKAGESSDPEEMPRMPMSSLPLGGFPAGGFPGMPGLPMPGLPMPGLPMPGMPMLGMPGSMPGMPGSMPGMPGMPGSMPGMPGSMPVMPLGSMPGLPGISGMPAMGEDMSMSMAAAGTAGHKKNLSVEIPGGSDPLSLGVGDLNTPNSIAMFNQLGSSVMNNVAMQLSPNAISLGSLGSGSGIGGGMNFPSPNTLAAFGSMVSGNTPRGAVGGPFSLPVSVPTPVGGNPDPKALESIPEKK